MARDSGTRSGMLWEVERILDECENKPQVLLMENVPDVIGGKNIANFVEWRDKLESLGYKCYWQVLNAKDYGVPQNRERCFMVSILGDYYYDFPKPIKLEHRLKDLLESEVDEKYYLSDRALQGAINTKFCCSKLENKLPKDGIVPTICARDYKDPKLVEITRGQSQGNRVYDPNGLSVSLCANGGGLGAKTGLYIEPKCLNSKVNGKQPSVQDRIYDTNAISTAITTSFMPSIAEESYVSKKYSEFEKENGYIPELFNPYNKTEITDVAPTQTTEYGSTTSNSTVLVKEDNILGVVVNSNNKRLKELVNKMDLTKDNQFMDIYNQATSDNAGTITTRVDASNSTAVYADYRIRKLTTRECFRLMGVKDQDFDNIAKTQSNASLYHLAGDSIVVDVLMHIFKNMLN